MTTEQARVESEEAATTTLKPRQHVVVDDSDLETEQQRQRVIELSKTILENDQQLESEEGEGDAVQRPKKSLTSSGSSGKLNTIFVSVFKHIPTSQKCFKNHIFDIRIKTMPHLFAFYFSSIRRSRTAQATYHFHQHRRSYKVIHITPTYLNEKISFLTFFLFFSDGVSSKEDDFSLRRRTRGSGAIAAVVISLLAVLLVGAFIIGIRNLNLSL